MGLKPHFLENIWQTEQTSCRVWVLLGVQPTRRTPPAPATTWEFLLHVLLWPQPPHSLRAKDVSRSLCGHRDEVGCSHGGVCVTPGFHPCEMVIIDFLLTLIEMLFLFIHPSTPPRQQSPKIARRWGCCLGKHNPGDSA